MVKNHCPRFEVGLLDNPKGGIMSAILSSIFGSGGVSSVLGSGGLSGLLSSILGGLL